MKRTLAWVGIFFGGFLCYFASTTIVWQTINQHNWKFYDFGWAVAFTIVLGCIAVSLHRDFGRGKSMPAWLALKKGEVVEVLATVYCGPYYNALVTPYPFKLGEILNLSIKDISEHPKQTGPYSIEPCRPIVGKRYIWTGKHLRSVI